VTPPRTGRADWSGSNISDDFWPGTLPNMRFEEPTWDGPYFGQFGVLVVRAGLVRSAGRRTACDRGRRGGGSLSTNP
jgi:hypothetical protein